MPCRIKIKRNITEKVYTRANKGLSMRYEDAALLQTEINKEFKSDVIRFYLDKDIISMDVGISEKLITEYYNNELRLETQEARQMQEADAKRAGVDYTDDYLFDEEEAVNPLGPSLAVYDEAKRMLGKKPDSFVAGQSKWQLNSKGLYNLVDMNSNNVFLRDMDMETGKLVTEEDTSGPVDPKKVEREMKYFNSLVVNEKLDEVLAELGIDIFDVIDDLEKAKTNNEFDKIMSDIRKKLCR